MINNHMIQMNEIHQSNGTTICEPNLNESNIFVTIEDISMCGEVFLYSAPKQMQYRIRNHDRIQNKKESQQTLSIAMMNLERSIKEYANIWSELAKY